MDREGEGEANAMAGSKRSFASTREIKTDDVACEAEKRVGFLLTVAVY
jgi:hypothetical protein